MPRRKFVHFTDFKLSKHYIHDNWYVLFQQPMMFNLSDCRILLNLNQNHSQRYKKYILTCTHLHSPLQQSGIHRVNIQGTIFKSKYPLHTWPSVSSYQNCQQYRQAVACDFDSVFSNYILTNRFHTVCILHKEESKVEKSVKALKEKVEKTGKEADETAKPTVQVTTGAEPAAPAVKLTIWGRVVAELKHYYHGFRLLFIDMKICTRLLWGVLNGKSLTRRERRQVCWVNAFCCA